MYMVFVVLCWVFAIAMIVFSIRKSKKKQQEKEQQAKKTDESNSESNSSSGIAYMSPEEMLSHARDIAEAPLPSQTSKPASVTGRAIVGGILGGTPGAIIGAASAIDKNNRSK